MSRLSEYKELMSILKNQPPEVKHAVCFDLSHATDVELSERLRKARKGEFPPPRNQSKPDNLG